MKKFCKSISSFLIVTLLLSFLVVTPAFAQNNDYVEGKDADATSTIGEISTTISSTEILSRLVAQEPFSIDGTLLTDSQTVELNEFYNFSTMSRFAIADWACRNDLITEEQKIESYCDLLTTRNFENIVCLDPIYKQIDNYAKKHRLDTTLNQKVSLVLNPTDQTQSVYAINSDSVNDGQIVVHDYDGVGILESELERILSMAQGIRSSYENMGIPFLNPDFDGYYVIALRGSSSGGSCETNPIGGSIEGNKQLSATTLYISVDGNGVINTSNTVLRQRLAHGMFHAIQNSYHSAEGWFKEACADWGAWAATGLTTGLNLNAFINSSLSMTANVGGGAMLFPATIARYYGGAATILEIYEQLSSVTSATFSIATLDVKITAALAARGYSSVDFADVFSRMSVNLATPGSSYSFITSGLQNTSAADITYSPGTDFTEDSADVLDRVYFTFEPATGVSNCTIEFEVVMYNGTGTVQQYWYNSEGVLCVQYFTPNANGVVTFYQPDSEEGNPTGFVGIVVTGVGESFDFSIDYTVTQN
ncbi:MAG: hypothetical protein IJX28_06645 [Clostridia bacterium]|nr:hypothetical protein [Clostridia bacterium]